MSRQKERESRVSGEATSPEHGWTGRLSAKTLPSSGARGPLLCMHIRFVSMCECPLTSSYKSNENSINLQL